MESKITGGPTTLLFTAKVLNKYDVKYYRCTLKPVLYKPRSLTGCLKPIRTR
jgi:hypothetical protein